MRAEESATLDKEVRAEEFATLGKEVRAEESATLGKKVRAEEYYIYTFDDDTDTGVPSCQLMQVPQYRIAWISRLLLLLPLLLLLLLLLLLPQLLL